MFGRTTKMETSHMVKTYDSGKKKEKEQRETHTHKSESSKRNGTNFEDMCKNGKGWASKLRMSNGEK